MAQTETQTDGHGDSMTNSAQWGRFGEKSCSWLQFVLREWTLIHGFYGIERQFLLQNLFSPQIQTQQQQLPFVSMPESSRP